MPGPLTRIHERLKALEAEGYPRPKRILLDHEEFVLVATAISGRAYTVDRDGWINYAFEGIPIVNAERLEAQ